jgi:hypothetical protein
MIEFGLVNDNVKCLNHGGAEVRSAPNLHFFVSLRLRGSRL